MLALPALLLAGWLGRLSALAAAEEERACGRPQDAIRELSSVEIELQRLLDEYSLAHSGVGLQAAVVFPDGQVWNGAAGYASHEQGCPLTGDHHLYIGSITKLYTAALVMEQVEKGALVLEDTLEHWVDLPYADTITLQMLLNHTSGIPSYTDDPWFRLRYFGLPQKQWRRGELVQVIRRKSLRFEPGSRYEYSNSNYLLLGVILEEATGQSYQALLRRLVGEQLGLRQTLYQSRVPPLLVASGYDESLLHLGRRNLSGMRTSLVSGAFSAGGILSTASETASFVDALFTGRILSASSLVQMQTFVDAPDPDAPFQQGYGLGVRNLVIDGHSLVGHTGVIPGYSGIALHNPREDYTIVILSNLSVIEQTHLFSQMQQVVLSRIKIKVADHRR